MASGYQYKQVCIMIRLNALASMIRHKLRHAVFMMTEIHSMRFVASIYNLL